MAALHRLACAAFEAQGVPAADARVAATALVEADARGQHGHGIVRLPSYLDLLAAGAVNPRPRIRPQRETSVSALVDGDNGLGSLVVGAAVDLAIDKAGTAGLAWIGTRRSNHAGAGGVYTARALEHDMIALYMAVSGVNVMAPWDGAEPLLGTNPIALAIPAGREPAVQVDVATSATSIGKIKLAGLSGERIPEGWVIDGTGRPVTDPSAAERGTLLPIGGHKGYGLALAIGLLAGPLNGAAFGRDLPSGFEFPRRPGNTGQVVIVVRPDLFGDPDEFKNEVDRHIRALRACAPLPGKGPVRVPGEGARAYADAVAEDGVPLTDAVIETLQVIADRVGLEEVLSPLPAR